MTNVQQHLQTEGTPEFAFVIMIRSSFIDYQSKYIPMSVI